MKIWTVLVVSVTLLAACSKRDVAVPDLRIPHKLTREVRVWVSVRKSDGTYVEQEVKADAGWWIASPLVVEGTP